MSEMKSKIIECQNLREKIKSSEDKMNGLAKKAEERKQALLEQLNDDPELKALREEFEQISEEHAKAITEFAEKNDSLLTEFGSEE